MGACAFGEHSTESVCVCVVPRSNTVGDEYATSMPWHIELVVLDIRKLKPPMEEINATGCVPRVLANARPPMLAPIVSWLSGKLMCINIGGACGLKHRNHCGKFVA